MVDIVFAVDDAHAWHHENITRNPTHYSLIPTLAHRVWPRSLGHMQHALRPHMYFNTLLTVETTVWWWLSTIYRRSIDVVCGKERADTCTYHWRRSWNTAWYRYLGWSRTSSIGTRCTWVGACKSQ